MINTIIEYTCDECGKVEQSRIKGYCTPSIGLKSWAVQRVHSNYACLCGDCSVLLHAQREVSRAHHDARIAATREAYAAYLAASKAFDDANPQPKSGWDAVVQRVRGML